MRAAARGGARLCADEQPLPPARHAGDRRRHSPDDAGRRPALSAAQLQPAARPDGNPLGGPLQVHPDPGRTAPAGLHGVHGPQPGPRGHGGRARGYRWSSHQHYIERRADKLVNPHALYWELGNTLARDEAYAALVRAGIQRGRAAGTDGIGTQGDGRSASQTTSPTSSGAPNGGWRAPKWGVHAHQRRNLSQLKSE